MIRSFTLALGLTSCISGFSALEAKPHPISEEVKKQKPYTSRAAAKIAARSLLYSPKKSRIVKKSKPDINCAALLKNSSFRRFALRNKSIFAPSFLGLYLNNPSLLQNKAKKFYATQKVTPKPALKKALVVRKKVDLVYKPIVEKVTFKAPVTRVSAVNDNKAAKEPINVTEETNNRPSQAESSTRQEAPNTSIPEETANTSTPQETAHNFSQREPDPVFSEPENTSSGASTSTPNPEESAADDAGIVRQDVMSNLDKIRSIFAENDLEKIQDDASNNNLVRLSQISARITQILSNNEGSTKGKSTAPRDIIKNLKDVLADGGLNYNAIAYGDLVLLKAFSASVLKDLSNVFEEAKQNATPSPAPSAELVQEVTERLADTKKLLKDYVPGVSTIDVAPKEVRSVKQSLWNLKKFLTNETYESKGGVDWVFMETYVTDVKGALENATMGSKYEDLVRAKGDFKNVLDNLKIGARKPDASTSKPSEPTQAVPPQASTQELPLLDRAKPVFGSLNAVLADPNLTLSAENESLMGQIIGQMLHIKEARQNVDLGNKDRKAVLRGMISNLSTLTDVQGNDAMILGLALVQAKSLLGKLENNPHIIIKLSQTNGK